MNLYVNTTQTGIMGVLIYVHMVIQTAIEIWTKVLAIKDNGLVSELNKCYHIIIIIIEIY